MSATLPSIDAIVATKGRAEIVARLVAYLREQTLPLDVFVISACDPSDVTGVAETSSATRIVFGSAGSSAQRNNGLSALPADIDIVVFLDDDFIPSRFWLARVRDIFVASPDIA